MTDITSYTELIEGLRTRVGELGVRYQDFDELAGFPAGLSGKVFGPSQVKRLGIEKVFDVLRATGMRISLEEDPEQAAKMRARIAENFNPRQANQARMNNHASAISSHVLSRAFGHILREARKKRWAKTSKAKRSEHCRAMANARWKKVRRANRLKKAAAARRAAIDAKVVVGASA